MTEPPKAHCFLVMKRESREVVGSGFRSQDDASQAAHGHLKAKLKGGSIIEACNREQILEWIAANPFSKKGRSG